MSFEGRVKAVIRRGLWPDNPNSVQMARALLRLARAMDRAPARARGFDLESLRNLLGQFAHCTPDPENVLDGIICRHVVKRAGIHASWLERVGDDEGRTDHDG